MRRRSWCLLLPFLLTAEVGRAQTLDTVVVGDLPGTDRRWQVGEVTVAAPASEVQRWFSEVSKWPERFPDDEWARELGRAADGRRKVEFRSKLLGRTLTAQLHEEPRLIAYDATGPGVTMRGKVLFQPAGPDRTQIVIQTTAELHGALGLFAPQGVRRGRALAKIRADLRAAVRLSQIWAATRRAGG
jgi:hypothetical protein